MDRSHTDNRTLSGIEIAHMVDEAEPAAVTGHAGVKPGMKYLQRCRTNSVPIAEIYVESL